MDVSQVEIYKEHRQVYQVDPEDLFILASEVTRENPPLLIKAQLPTYLETAMKQFVGSDKTAIFNIATNSLEHINNYTKVIVVNVSKIKWTFGKKGTVVE